MGKDVKQKIEQALQRMFNAHPRGFYRFSLRYHAGSTPATVYFSPHMTPNEVFRDFTRRIDQSDWNVEPLNSPDAYQPFRPKRRPLITRYGDGNVRVWQCPCTYQSFIETCKTLLTQNFPTFTVDARFISDGAGNSRTVAALGLDDTTEPDKVAWTDLKRLTETAPLTLIQVFRRIVSGLPDLRKKLP